MTTPVRLVVDDQPDPGPSAPVVEVRSTLARSEVRPFDGAEELGINGTHFVTIFGRDREPAIVLQLARDEWVNDVYALVAEWLRTRESAPTPEPADFDPFPGSPLDENDDDDDLPF